MYQQKPVAVLAARQQQEQKVKEQVITKSKLQTLIVQASASFVDHVYESEDTLY